MKPAVRNRLIIGAAVVLAGGLLAHEMFFSLTPPRHADHDHAMSSLAAGGFLWVEAVEGGRRNLVGAPGKVLVLHWFDAAAVHTSEPVAAANWAASVAADPSVEVLLIARTGPSVDPGPWADDVGIPRTFLYADPEGRTADLIGVRRYPETLVYDPSGTLAFQTRGPADWGTARFRSMIEKARAGGSEVH